MRGSDLRQRSDGASTRHNASRAGRVVVGLAAVGIVATVSLYLSRPLGEALILLIAVAGLLAFAYRRVGATPLRDHHEAEWDRVHALSKRAPSSRKRARPRDEIADGTGFPTDGFEAPFRSHRG